MPSVAHQSLLLWIARKMAVDGYFPGGYEGSSSQGGVLNALPLPFEIHGVRPDIWGLSEAGAIALGEAKTACDVAVSHTVQQLRIFGNLRDRATGRACRLYVAVPESAVRALDRALAQSGLRGSINVHRLHIPDCLIMETSL